MDLRDEFCLQEYQDLGTFEENQHIRLLRHRYDGTICLEKRVPASKINIYRFLKAAKTKGVPEIFACIEHEEELIVIEKYIEGKTLEMMLREKLFSEVETIKVMLSLCDTLGELHHGHSPVICRDLKADNIIVDTHQQTWIVDFDIARVFHEGKKRDTELLGTAEYAAPEQFGFFQTDCRTDIYSLGVLMNYMLTGKFPVEQMADGKLGRMIEKCTFLDPAKRYQQVEELKADLLRAGGRFDQEMPAVHKSWLPPGFRSRKISHMLTAIAGYIGLTAFAFSLEMQSEEVMLTGFHLHIEQAVFWLAELAIVFVLFNYRGWRDELPLLKSRNLMLRVAGDVLASGFILFFAIFVCALIETFFF